MQLKLEVETNEGTSRYKMKEWFWKFLRHRLFIVILCTISLLCALIVYQILPLFHEPYQSNLRLAETKFFEWKKDPANLELFNDLNCLLEKDPRLLRRYDGQVAQVLIESQQSNEVLPYARIAIERLKIDAPYYSLYSTATYQINQGKFHEALQNAMNLKEELEISFTDRKNEDLSMGAVLYAFNLIRIAFLNKTLNQKEFEILAWKNVQSFFGWTEVPCLSYRASAKIHNIVLENYREKNIDLKAYIFSRLLELES